MSDEYQEKVIRIQKGLTQVVIRVHRSGQPVEETVIHEKRAEEPRKNTDLKEWVK